MMNADEIKVEQLPVLIGKVDEANALAVKPLKVKAKLPYAVELECDEPETRHWRHPWCIDQNGGDLALLPPILPAGSAATVPNCFDLSAKQHASKPCMGTRPITRCRKEGSKQYWTKAPYAWKTYSEVHEDVLAAARGLLDLPGVKSRREAGEECVAAILADTSAEWQVSSQAAFQCGIPITTIYTTLGQEAMMHGINQTQAMVLFIDWMQYELLSEPVISKCPSIRHIILIGRPLVPLETLGGETKPFPSPEDAAALPKIGDAATTTLEGLMTVGRKNETDLATFAPKPEDVAIIMYTSGSTGLPKGVVLSHSNFVSVVASAVRQGVVEPKAEDVYIAYLPLAHIFELVVETVFLCQGASIGYGHARTLSSSSPYMHPDDASGSDLLACRPTIMAAVPAILDTIRTGLCNKLEEMPGFKGRLVRGAVNRAQGLPMKGGLGVSCLLGCGPLPRALLRKVRATLGLDRLRLIVSGGAPLAAETQEYLTAVLAPVAQGYGATETCGCASVQEVVSSNGRPVDRSSGLCGAIQPACELKLRSVPEMGYLVTDCPPRGEILLSGNNVSQTGYYKMPAKSAEDFPRHADGKVWFHTGDIGVITETGALKIVDRKKDLIKLTGGEYVSLGKVEAALKQVQGIGAVVVFARPDKDHCVAIVSQPDKGWAFVGGKPDEASLTKAVEAKLKSMGFARFEIPSKLKVDEEIWTPESGLVTASLKVQRNPLREHYNQAGGLLEQMDYQFASA
eukprot:TRINITY_DN2697_c0_g1_i1.p1 TRINITY_DN2697_c0_g1~~TRINITY_DN2697_c0_g1_i1.p1  ORF type:complete len:741 (+),score=154.39 TRINITY_DN2697_c0_g1_i1:89-2311(+)